MIELKKDFEVKKHRLKFHQLFKDNELVIYGVAQPFADSGGETKWYEVFKYKTHPKDIFHSEEYEMYPNDECFGVWAWSCNDLNVVRKVLSHPTRGHFRYDDSTTSEIIAKITMW